MADTPEARSLAPGGFFVGFCLRAIRHGRDQSVPNAYVVRERIPAGSIREVAQCSDSHRLGDLDSLRACAGAECIFLDVAGCNASGPIARGLSGI